MKILILGHRGLLGSELYSRLSPGHEIVGKDADDFDITAEDECRKLIAEVYPEVLINAAGYTDVDKAETERDLCFAVNAYGVRNISLACRPTGTKIIHFSTDYVFDGTKETPYLEADPCRPLNVYGEAKLAGEQYLRQHSENYLLIRTAWLYGKHGKNFVKTILAKAKGNERLEIVNDQRGSPTYVKDLAAAVEKLLIGSHQGVFHVTNRGTCTWYEFALKILANAGLNEVSVTPVSSTHCKRPATRPRNSVLGLRRFIETTGNTTRFWQLALMEYMDRERMHSENWSSPEKKP